MFINTTQDLEKFCTLVESPPYLALDTEFVRERTYYPILCLVQVATPKYSAVIDAQAPGLDFAPLWALLKQKNTIKVFHAGFQDLEIISHMTGFVPTPIFDTQIAAEFCGFGDSTAYDTLVNAFTGVTLDKSSRATDWQKRPLSDKQILYARNDVVHLCTVYEKLYKRLEKLGRLEWVHEEMKGSENPDMYRIDPQQAWRKIKGTHLKPRNLARVIKLCAWREEIARLKDKPKRRILLDEAIIELAKQNPQNPQEISDMRFLASRISKEFYDDILGCLRTANSLPEDHLPETPHATPYPLGHGERVDLLKIVLKKVCEENQISPRLLANAADLNTLALQGDKAPIQCLSGWRREIFGTPALSLLKGEIALKIVNNQVVLVR